MCGPGRPGACEGQGGCLGRGLIRRAHAHRQGSVRPEWHVQPGDLRGRHLMVAVTPGEPPTPGAAVAGAAALRAFDAERPPRQDLIDACVHCGFCLPTCPTYVLWGEEMDSPRGRIVLMNEGLEPGSSMTDSMVTHLDRCLGCMACVTACPSGVQYDRLIEAVRPQIERNHPRPWGERAFHRAVFETFTHPARLRALVPLFAAGRRLGLTGVAGRPWARHRFPRLAALARLAPEGELRSRWAAFPSFIQARGQRRGRVALLQGCVQRVLFAHVNQATASVLSAEGFDVLAPRQPRCCGALMMHSG